MTESEMDELENELCARIRANDHAMNVAVARLLPVVAPAGAAAGADEDPERWDGLS